MPVSYVYSCLINSQIKTLAFLILSSMGCENLIVNLNLRMCNFNLRILGCTIVDRYYTNSVLSSRLKGGLT